MHREQRLIQKRRITSASGGNPNYNINWRIMQAQVGMTHVCVGCEHTVVN
jgi:hypothetical protein